MAKEIERKFLLSGFPHVAEEIIPIKIEQGYISTTESTEIRVRKITEHLHNPKNGTAFKRYRYYLTVKIGHGKVREEIENRITKATFERLWPITIGHRIQKHRYKYKAPDGLIWEIDHFSHGLVTVEVELPSEDTPIKIPMKLELYVVREITGEVEFSNQKMAK